MDVDAEKLNNPEVLLPHAHRRNHTHYEMVSYVNCLLGCRISGNVEGEALFLERVKRFMADHTPTPEMAGYYEAVESFLHDVPHR